MLHMFVCHPSSGSNSNSLAVDTTNDRGRRNKSDRRRYDARPVGQQWYIVGSLGVLWKISTELEPRGIHLNDLRISMPYEHTSSGHQ
jgi:hypothetical protein